MVKKYDKPFKDFPELIDLLKERGVIIHDEERAEDLLKIYGYYPVINGFKKYFQCNTSKEIYKKNTDMETIVGEFILDSQFQEIFLSSVLKIENHFDNTIGYEVAKSFDVENDDSLPKSYLNKENYYNNGHIKVGPTISYIKKTIYETRDNPVAYYRERKNHIPPWIMMMNLSLGCSIKYYQILPKKLKNNIVDEMILPNGEDENEDLKKSLFLTSMEILRDFRNKAAHSSPIYLNKTKLDNNFSLKALHFYLGNDIISRKEYKNGLGKGDLFSSFVSLILLTRNNGQRNNLIKTLINIEQTYMNDEQNGRSYYSNYLSMSGLPEDYINRLLNASTNLGQLH